MNDYLVKFMMEKGYHIRSTNVADIICYYQIVQSGIIAVLTVRDNGETQTSEQLIHIRNTVAASFSDYSEVHILTLVMGNDMERAKVLAANDRFTWFLHEDERKLVIYETQVAEFYGVKKLLEDFLVQSVKMEKEDKKQQKSNVKKFRRKGIKIGNYYISASFPYITTVLIVLNVLIFFICTLTGDMLYNTGELYGPYVLENGQFYRIITAMFLHANISHLLNNMLVLLAAGQLIENEYSHVRYTLLYFLAGIGGGIVSMAYAYQSGHLYSSVGASGAIFGLIGALLFLVVYYRGGYQGISLGRVIFAIGFSIYIGVSSSGTDNAAHIGGLITGFLVSALLTTLANRKDRGKR